MIRYNDKKYFVGSKWYDTQLKQSVELVYCRNMTTVKPVGELSENAYYIKYDELGTRLLKLSPTRTMIKIFQAQKQLLDEVNKLEEGKLSIDKLIEEKQKQIAEFNLLINKISREAGNSKLVFKNTT